MTNQAETEPLSSKQPLLAFDPQDLVSMRVRPADFARMCKVSRQAVSKWVERGVITLGPDGLLDPVKAGREVLARTDPARLRARVFRDAFKDVDTLRADRKRLQAENEALRLELSEQRERLRYFIHRDEAYERLEAFLEALTEALAVVGAADRITPAELDYLASRHFWQMSDEELAELDPDLDEMADEFEQLEASFGLEE